MEHIMKLVSEHRDKVEETEEAIMNEMRAITMELDVEICMSRLATKR